MKFTVVLMTGVALLLPLSLLVSLLMTWQSSERTTAEEIESPSVIKNAASQGGSNRTGVQGQSRNTSIVPVSEKAPKAEGAAPLGTEMSPEELRRIKEGRGNTPVPQMTNQQEDSSQ
ncbi:MAG TPA: hypothetical protein DCE56_07445 [Cyanobacteria bacterium UBA8553]|nr:hypothetical protein [Cyanobacteria bacterium UBA8553]